MTPRSKAVLILIELVGRYGPRLKEWYFSRRWPERMFLVAVGTTTTLVLYWLFPPAREVIDHLGELLLPLLTID